ncbi:hypothetical protein [Mucilaginibacter endophyticus]|uniref:hypothetical protein n=1 Tax=Mucilaginibacter endophyticus TaxID=2675003 RepID=UPI000E0DB1F9|nr:hypothetical protein [Mucilaginibacter endophyticus]
MTINSEILEVLNENEICDKAEDSLSGFYVFSKGITVNNKSEVFFNINSEAHYKICFFSKSGYPTLSFTYLNPQPIVPDNINGYQTYFTESLLSKELLALAVKFDLFRPEMPARFLVSNNQEWRINEIYKSMIDECSGSYRNKPEMVRTLIHELILFTRRLVPVLY